jgi:putative ABC transport system permease protein
VTALTRFAVSGLVRSPGRTLIRVLTLAAAAALLASMLLFIGHSLRTMTATAVRSVPLDWQGPAASHDQAVKLAAAVKQQSGVQGTAPVATAPFASATHASPSGEIRTGAGALLAVPPDYPATFHTFRFLRGSLKPGEVVLDQQLAATLQAQPGDTVALQTSKGGKPVRFRVSGVGVVTAPDVLFQPLGPLAGSAPSRPPANIAILPLDTFAQKVAPALPSVSSASPTLPGTPTGVQWQVQAQVDPTMLTGSPAAALAKATQLRNKVERLLTGRIVFVDNLESTLTGATGDALYAETLYIMLAVPGALVALALAYLAALGTVERDRADLVLLRARGASLGDLVTVAGIESLLLGIVAGALGTAVALLAVGWAHASTGGTGGWRILAAFGICSAVAIAGAAAARLGASLSIFRQTVLEGRRGVRRESTPLWQKLWLDLLCLIGSGLIYWLTARTGFSAVVSPDSNPTLSLSVYMFFAPALLWIGSTLLLVRLRGRGIAWLAGRAVGGRATTTRGFLLVSASRRGGAINRGLLVVGLLLAFGVNLGVFTATYNQQATVDAELTLGADVVVTAPPGAVVQKGLAQKAVQVQGVKAVSPVDHSYAYVGPDLQDTFGVDPNSLQSATTLRDSYFIGGTASQMMTRLRARPDAILVSKETMTDYSLALNDLLRLRVLDHKTGKFKVVPFHVAGVVIEFPSAPKDSFMVANLSYLEKVSNGTGPNVVFAKANGDPAAVARRVAAATKQFGTIVKDIKQQSIQTVSSITTVDLTGISRIEELFAVVLAAAATALFVSVSLVERRRELATMAAIGASLREVGAFLWTEAALVVAGAVALAALLGWLLAEMLVAMLQHVFDPPPDHLTVPWAFLGALVGSAVLGTLLAAAISIVGLRRLPLGAVLRED